MVPPLPSELWMMILSNFVPRKSTESGLQLHDPLYKWAVPYHLVDVAAYHRQRLAQVADQEVIVVVLNLSRTLNATMRYLLKEPPRSLQSLTFDTLELANKRTRIMRQRYGDDWGYREIEILADVLEKAPQISALIRDHRHTLRSLTISVHFGFGFGSGYPRKFYYVFANLPCLESLRFFVQCHPSGYHTTNAVLGYMAGSPKLKHLALSQLTPDRLYSQHLKAPVQLETLEIRRIRSGFTEHSLSSLVSSSHQTLKELNFVYEFQPFCLDCARWPWWHRGLPASAVRNAFAPCVAIEVLRVAHLIKREELGIEEELDGEYLNGQLDQEDPVLGVMVDGMVLPLKNLRVLETAGKVFTTVGLTNNLNLSGCSLSQMTILLYPEFPMDEFLVELKKGHRALTKLKKLTLGKTVWSSSESAEVLDGLLQLCKERGIELTIKDQY